MRSSHHEHGGLVVHPVWRAEQGVVAREELVPVLGAVNRVTSSDLSCSCEVSRQTASKTLKRPDNSINGDLSGHLGFLSCDECFRAHCDQKNASTPSSR